MKLVTAAPVIRAGAGREEGDGKRKRGEGGSGREGQQRRELPGGPTTTGLHVLRTCTPRSERNPRPEVTCCRRQVRGCYNATYPIFPIILHNCYILYNFTILCLPPYPPAGATPHPSTKNEPKVVNPFWGQRYYTIATKNVPFCSQTFVITMRWSSNSRI